jgi:hypothetical protein
MKERIEDRIGKVRLGQVRLITVRLGKALKRASM